MLRVFKFQTAKICFQLFSAINLAPCKSLNFFSNTFMFREKNGQLTFSEIMENSVHLAMTFTEVEVIIHHFHQHCR